MTKKGSNSTTGGRSDPIGKRSASDRLKSVDELSETIIIDPEGKK